MRCFRVLPGIAALAISTVASAEDCWICDDEVEITKPYAECYLENFDLLMEEFESQGVERHQVNFAGCELGDAPDSSRGGIVVMGTLPNGASSTKSVYTLSRHHAICLNRLIEENYGQLNPSIVFNLAEQCDDE